MEQWNVLPKLFSQNFYETSYPVRYQSAVVYN